MVDEHRSVSLFAYLVAVENTANRNYVVSVSLENDGSSLTA